MAAPKLVKSWTVTPNVRRAYTSLLDTASWWMYQNKVALAATHWPTWFSCDGVTGPASSADHTDRWAAQANAQTRATIDAAAQSWWIGKNTEGAQILLDYQGATDDIVRVSYSPGGLFTLAGTTTQRPTATDEVVISAATTIASSATSLDRVMSIWVSATGWRNVVFRNSAIVGGYSLGRANSLADAGTFDIPYVFGNFIDFTRTMNVTSQYNPVSGMINPVAVGAASFRGFAGRVFTAAASRIARMGGVHLPGKHSVISSAYSANVTTDAVGQSDKPAAQSQASSPLLPIYLLGEATANLDGYWGYPADWWQMITTSVATPALADPVPGFDPADVPGVSGGQTGVGDARTNWCIAIGAAAVWPWRNAAATMEIT